ncbi:SNF1-related protein kinase regulatory subunit gamma-1-like [Cornus florida]|uniref:SNF1-related protein kinase regulatory subunit gamma-1-like n=1 Tax=Cornus florida TaxID=4283 RepID=UPI00289F4BD0|nr:SNF1-related protein kinase regulatory subunit gamma-1-like [Cornus florida]
MDLRGIGQVMKDSKGDNNHPVSSSSDGRSNPHADADSATALQLFLDRIPINSIPGINNSSTVSELKKGDCLADAIRLMYKKNVFGAPIADDVLDSDTTTNKFLDKFMGFIDFPTMVLWCLEECEDVHIHTKDEEGNEMGSNSFFSMLDQNPRVAQTKIGELAKSFLWDPFFPVNLENTLFHVMLLLSKHPLQFVPVTEQSSSKVIGFVSQNAVIQLLFQSSGLEWFDSIADKALSEFHYENDEHVVHVYGDQSIAEAIHILWKKRIGAVAVVERETNRLIGCVRSTDLHLLLDNDDLFSNRKSVTVEKFIHMDTSKVDSDPTIERDLGALLSAGTPALRNNFLPRMDSPVTNRKTDTLKQAMKNLAERKCNFSFLIDESHQVKGMLILRDIITQFSPPSVDSTFKGGGFFDTALEQTGCHVERGTIICDH